MPAIQFIKIVTGGVEPSASTDGRNVSPFLSRRTVDCNGRRQVSRALSGDVET